jgi:hypothetical protein
MKNRRNELAPCGVFCRACPSYDKTCNGCSSENKNQKRKSKWNCKIRKCCYEEMNVEYCGNCNSFPCEKINSKLIKSHIGDKKFKYRHEISENMKKLKELGLDKFIKFKEKEYTCRYCNGTIHFYHYRCSLCGKPSNIN